MIFQPNRRMMPLDRCQISTSFEITREVFTDREQFNERHSTNILNLTLGSKVQRGDDVTYATLAFESYDGITLRSKQQPNGRWYVHTIDFNPRKVLYRHNGYRLSEEDALLALSVLVDEVSPLLVNPADDIHIVPGLAPRSIAYWNSLELTVDLYDPDKRIAKALRNARYPRIKESLTTSDGNVYLGANDSPFRIKLYDKTLEMKNLFKDNEVKEPIQVFRLEILLRQTKPIEHLGDESSVREIDGKKRLVRFTSARLTQAISRVVGKMTSNTLATLETDTKKNRLARFMAALAHTRGIPLTELFELYETHIAPGKKTKKDYRKAAYEAYPTMSLVSLADVFHAKVFEQQPSICLPGLDRTVQERRDLAREDYRVRRAYTDTGPGVAGDDAATVP